MTCRIYEAEYANHKVRYSLVYSSTRFQFHPWLKKTDETEADIQVTEELLERVRKMLPEDSSDSYVEYRCLIELTARELLKYGCCIFHSVSFVWHGYAWLLAAPSGTGKTTQYMNWQQLYPGEITMICGDMPVIECREDGMVWAHPTSWNGKENIGGKICAPVAGIVFLEQGGENHIDSLTISDVIMHFFRQFMVRPRTEDEIVALSRIMDQMVRKLPVWKMVNKGDNASTDLLRNTLAERLNELTGGENGST